METEHSSNRLGFQILLVPFISSGSLVPSFVSFFLSLIRPDDDGFMFSKFRSFRHRLGRIKQASRQAERRDSHVLSR